MNTYRVMTFNLQTDLPYYYGDLLFKNRFRSILAIIRYYNPDIIGVQELSEDMLPMLDELNDTYVFYGHSRNRQSAFANERCCILYRKNRFTAPEGETFWLSSRPNTAGSREPGSIYPRIATRLLLKDNESGEEFTVCNTHLDHMFPITRRKQAEDIRDHLQKNSKGRFTVITGDFNASLATHALQTLVNDPVLDVHDVLSETSGPTIRIPRLNPLHTSMPIDHILLSRNLHIIQTKVIRSRSMGVYPSDHYPVLCTFQSL